LQENQNTNEQLQPQALPDAPVKSNSENSASEIPLLSSEVKEKPSQLQTTNPKPQTDSMEVHKHPHHVMHKKKWSKYLLEFFMLFLAVFLGFIAENIREHQVEREHARELAGNYYEELKGDSTAIFTTLENRNRKDSALLICKIISGTAALPIAQKHLR
jgi:hypothetical protein